MTASKIGTIYQSLNSFEKQQLQQSRLAFEARHNLHFINLQAYIRYLAREVMRRQQQGEFMPRSQQEAQLACMPARQAWPSFRRE